MGALKQWTKAEGIALRKVDFDQEEGQQVVAAHRVLSIPTIVMLEGDRVRGRVEGFPGTEAYLAQLQAIAAKPQDQEEAGVPVEPTVAHTRSLILSGQVEAGLQMAAAVAAKGSDPDKDAVAVLVGRYYIRVKKDFEPGVKVLETRLQESEGKASLGVVYWLASGLAGRDGTESALTWLKEWEQEQGTPVARSLRASFMNRFGVHTPELSELLVSLAQDMPEKASIHFLRALDFQRQGDVAKALECAKQAHSLLPERAQYTELLRKLEGTVLTK